MSRLTETEQHKMCQPQVLALWLAAKELGIKQGSIESMEFEEMKEESMEVKQDVS